MQVPIQISYRDVPVSEALSALIRAEAEKLEKYYQGIIACRVVVEHAYSHQQNGAPYHIGIVMEVPGMELTITDEPNLGQHLRANETTRVRKSAEVEQDHKDAQVAVRDAFRKAKRRLQDYAQRRQGDVKTHEPPLKVRLAEETEV